MNTCERLACLALLALGATAVGLSHAAAAPAREDADPSPPATQIPILDIRPGGGDDAPQIAAALSTCAHACAVRLGDGTFTIASRFRIPSGSTILLSGGTAVNSTLTDVTDPAGNTGHWGPLYTDDAVDGAHANITALSAPTTPGSSTLVLETGDGYAVGQWIAVTDGVWYAAYQVTSLVGATVTTERPILKPFPAGAMAYTIAGDGPPHDIAIIGDKGATLQGTGPRGIQLAACRHCTVRGVRILSSFFPVVGSFDWGGVGNSWEDVDVEYVAGPASYGLIHEDGEGGRISNVSVTGPFASAVGGNGNAQLTLTNVHVTGASRGFNFDADEGDTTVGNVDITLTGCSATRCSAAGFSLGGMLGAPGSDIRLLGCSAQYNKIGVEVSTDNAQVVGGLFAGNEEQAFAFAANTKGNRLIGVHTKGNWTRAPGNTSLGVVYLGTNAELSASGLVSEEESPEFSFQAETGVTLTLEGWQHTSSFGGGAYGIVVAPGGTGGRIRLRDPALTFTGAGGNFPFSISGASTFWIDGLSLSGHVAAPIYAAGGSTVIWGATGEVSVLGDGSARFNYGSITADGTGTPQTIPAACPASQRPPFFTQTEIAGDCTRPPMVVMGASSFTVAWDAACTGTFSWRC